MSIIVQNLVKIFGEQKAVDDISFEIKPGNIVGFLGPNGAGKSTTMKILTTFLPPTDGSANVAGYDVVKEPMAVRKNVGYLPEKNPLYLDMYVREFLNLTADLHQLGREKKARVDEMIELTGLQKEIRKKIGTLSKGYKQRVGLAQAMIHHPPVLILDEPTSGLDPNQLSEIRTLISDIGKQRTVLLSTHIMQEVKAMCNRVIIINNGRLVADDTLEEIKNKGSRPTVTVEFAQRIDIDRLKAAIGSTPASPLSDKSVRFETEQPELLRKEIMQWALREDMAIVNLTTEGESLEETFRNLTRATDGQ